jgi:hypothetical protein
MTVVQFIGAWRLISMENRLSDGAITHPFGPDAIGILTYDATGNMAVQIMSADRPAFAADDFRAGADAEVRAAYEGILTYFGSYTVDETARTVTHHVFGASFPNRQGTDLVRRYTLDGDRLTLSTPPTLMGGALLNNVLTWERISR